MKNIALIALLAGGLLSTSYGAGYAADSKPRRLSAEQVKEAGNESNKLYSLAEQKQKAGKLDEAKQLYYRAAALRTHVWGQGDQAVSKIAIHIGQIELKQGHVDIARKWFKQSLTSLSKHFGPGDFELVDALLELAKLEAGQKHHEEASSYYAHALALQERKFGDAGAVCVSTRVSLVKELIAMKDISEADKVLKKAFSIEETKKITNAKENAELKQLLQQVQAAGTNAGSK